MARQATECVEEPSVSFEQRMIRVEKAMFGFRREDDGAWIDGILQQMADIRKNQESANRLYTKFGVPVAIVIAGSVFASMLHNYGLAEVIGHLLKGFTGQ